MIAIFNNQKSVVEYLSQYEAGVVDNEDKFALIHAITNNRPEFIQYLQQELKMKDKDGKTTLIHTVILNKPQYVQLLKEGLKIQDNQGKTALYYACFYGYMECTKQLLDESCIRDVDRLIPQKVALNEKHPDCVQLIAEYLVEKAEILEAKNETLQTKTQQLEKQIVELNQKNSGQQTVMQKAQDCMEFQ